MNARKTLFSFAVLSLPVFASCSEQNSPQTLYRRVRNFVVAPKAAEDHVEHEADALTTPQTTVELKDLRRPVESPLYVANPELARRAVERMNATYYFLLGQRLSAKGNSDEALVSYDQLKKIDGESSEVYYFLAQEFLKKEMMAEGIAAARKSLELNPNNRETEIFLGNLFATAKKYSEATQLFEHVLKNDPDNEDVMLYMALMESEQKQTTKAFTRISQFIKSNPESALALYYLGRLEQERGNPKKAIDAYQKAIDIRPGFVQAGTFLAFLQEESGDLKGAIETYSWLSSQTDDAVYHKKLGHLLLDENQYLEALKAFQNFERVDKTDANNKVKIALVQLELKEYDAAIKKFEEVLQLVPDSENVRYYLGAVYEQKNDLKRAVEHYSKIPVSAKLYPDAFRRRIFALAKLGSLDEGWGLVTTALKSVPLENMTEEDVYEVGARFLDEFDNQSEKNLEFINQGLAKISHSERLLYMKGGALDKLGRKDEAIAQMQAALKVNPKSAQALNFIGYSWAERGMNLDQAEKMVRKALQVRPKDAFITDSLGWVLYQKKDYQGARKALEEAVASHPEEPVFADHLADVLVKLGQFEDAKKYYEIALKLGPSKDVDKKVVEEKLAKISAQIDSRCQITNVRDRPESCSKLLPDNSRAPASQSSPR